MGQKGTPRPLSRFYEECKFLFELDRAAVPVLKGCFDAPIHFLKESGARLTSVHELSEVVGV